MKPIASLSIAAAMFAGFTSANAATIFQIDFQRSGSPAGQESESGWTTWEIANTTAALSPTSSEMTVGGVGVTITALGTGGYLTGRGGTTEERGGEITGTSWNDMVEDSITARSGTGTGAGDMSIALTGLTAGLTYTLTGWHNDSYSVLNNAGFASDTADNDTGYAITPTMTLGTLVGTADAGAATNVRPGARSDTDFDTSVISFTADGSGNATILLTGDSGRNFLVTSGLQLTAVPEPSAALLGSLGVLALLRRRR